jgi:hypothetical protein
MLVFGLYNVSYLNPPKLLPDERETVTGFFFCFIKFTAGSRQKKSGPLLSNRNPLPADPWGGGCKDRNGLFRR